MVIADGQTYDTEAEVWDTGSFTAVRVNGSQRHYEGLSEDVNRLPHYVDSGSSALCLDTGAEYRFHRPTDTWYKVGRASGSGGGTGGEAGSMDYEEMVNKPRINGVTLTGNKTLEEIGIGAENLDIDFSEYFT